MVIFHSYVTVYQRVSHQYPMVGSISMFCEFHVWHFNLSNPRYLNFFCCPESQVYISPNHPVQEEPAQVVQQAMIFFFCACLNYPEVYRMNMEYETLNDLNLMILVFS